MTAAPRTVALFTASPVVRRAVRRALRKTRDLTLVVDGHTGGEAARQVAAEQPDLVVVDTYLPDVDGYDLVRSLAARHDTPILLLVEDADDERNVTRALTAGALHVTRPPAPPGVPGADQEARAFVELLRALAGTRGPHAPLLETGAAPADQRSVTVVGIVSSAGGPFVLERLLNHLPAGEIPPILLVQHLASGFTRGFAEWLAESTGYPVQIAEDDVPARAGVLYVGPEDTQFWMDREGLLVVQAADPREAFRPCGDLLLARLAAEHGPNAVGIVLSGMGDDGAEGALALRRAGGRVLAQADAPIDSMPGAAVARGAVDAVLSADDIADWLIHQRTSP